MIGNDPYGRATCEQALRLEALLPERCALTRPPTRDQERPGRVLAEARAEQRGPPDLLHDEVLELLRLDEQLRQRRRRVRVGEVECDPVVRPERLHLERRACRGARPGAPSPTARGRGRRTASGRRPASRRSRRGTARRRPCGRSARAPCRCLVAEEGEEVLRRALVEVVLLAEPRRRAAVREGRRARATPRRSSARARRAARRPRPSRTAPRRARRAPARRARGRG